MLLSSLTPTCCTSTWLFTWHTTDILFWKYQAEAWMSPIQLNSLSGPLSWSRTDEKPWSATRHVGETHQADGKSVSFWVTFSHSGQFVVHQQVDIELFQIDWRGLGMKIFLEWPAATKEGRKGGVKSAWSREGYPLDRNASYVIFTAFLKAFLLLFF